MKIYFSQNQQYITFECHNILGWNKKHYFNEWLGQTMSRSILIFWQSLWPNFYPKWSKFAQNWTQNNLFPLFWLFFLVFLLKHPQNSTDFHNGSYFNISSQKNFFCSVGLPAVGPESAQIIPKLHFCAGLHQFVRTFSINYL